MLLWKKQPSRNHAEIMFAFEIFHEEDQILPRKWHLEAATRSCSMKKKFMSMKSLKKSTAPESFLIKVSSWRLVTLFKKRLWRKCFYPVNVENFLSK